VLPRIENSLPSLTDSALLTYHPTVSTPAIVPRIPGLSLPAELRIGDTLTFEVKTTLPTGWFLFFVLNAVINNTPTRILIGSTGVGVYTVALDANSIGTFTVAGTVTATWTAGRYQWVAFSVDSSGNREQLASGVVDLLPDPAGTTAVDTRSYNQKALDSIRACVLGAVMDDTMMYKIGTRELTKISRKELLALEAEFEGRVKRERRRRGEILPKRGLGVNFGGR
jgi:hypothetical protein